MDSWSCTRCGRVWPEEEQRCPVCWGWDHLRQSIDKVELVILLMRADLAALEEQSKVRG